MGMFLPPLRYRESHTNICVAGVGANTSLRDANTLAAALTEAANGRITTIEAISRYEERMRDYANEAVALSRRNAESASSGETLQRRGFRFLLRLAQAAPPVLRATIGKGAVKQGQAMSAS